MLTKLEAWQKVLGYLQNGDHKVDEFNDMYIEIQGEACYGLCLIIWKLHDMDLIDYDLYQEMGRQVKRGKNLYTWPLTIGGYYSRVEAVEEIIAKMI